MTSMYRLGHRYVVVCVVGQCAIEMKRMKMLIITHPHLYVN